MRVLVVDEEIPYPPNSGKRLRTYNLFKHLARRHEIVWLSRRLEGVQSSSKEFEDLGIRTCVVEDPVRKKSGTFFYLSLVKNLFSRDPYVVASHYSKKLSEAISDICRRESFDLIHCEWTPYAVNLPATLPCPVLGMAHNVEYMVWRRNSSVERNIFRRIYIGLQASKMEQFERKSIPKFTRTIAVSDYDRDIISRWISPDKVAVVPNGVDIELFHPPKEAETPGSLVFVGSLDWRPNVDCVNYFLDDIWPLIMASCPAATFSIIGRNPSRALEARAAKALSVSLHGSVEDVRPYIAGSQICVVPLRIGSGSRLKILEAFAMQKAVVSTSVGAEGLEVEDGKHILIADDPAEFSAAVSRLLQDNSYRNQIACAGRKLVESRYCWDRLAAQLESEWEKTACRRAQCQ